MDGICWRGFHQDDYWSTKEFDGEDEACPYNFRQYMSKNRFDTINSGLFFTDLPKPTLIDKFWEVRQMIAEWNKNIAVFSAGWVVCLDESMSIWHNRWHVLARYFVLANRTNMATSITLHVVHCVVFFSSLNSFRGRTTRRNLARQSLRLSVGRLVDCCLGC